MQMFAFTKRSVVVTPCFVRRYFTQSGVYYWCQEFIYFFKCSPEIIYLSFIIRGIVYDRGNSHYHSLISGCLTDSFASKKLRVSCVQLQNTCSNQMAYPEQLLGYASVK
jgi:hypothetical protein